MSTPSIAISKPRSLSPLAALLWEEWRQTRVPLLIGTLLAALAAAGIVVSERRAAMPLREEEIRGILISILFLLFFWQAATLLFSGYGRNDLTLQFPRRLFVLPLKSIALALTRLGYGVAVVTLTFGILGWLLVPSPAAAWTAYGLALFAMNGLIYIEAIAWLFGRRPMLAVPMGLVLWLPFAHLFKMIVETAPSPSYVAVTLGWLPATVVFTAVAVYAVATQRSGRMGGAGLLKGLRLMRVAATGDPDTPRRALFGFEWHRRGRWVPVFGLSGFLLMPLTTPWIMNPMYAFSAGIMGAIAGIGAAGFFQIIVDERDRVSGVHRFLSTKPSSTRDLATARLKALAAGWTVTFLIMLATIPLFTLIFHGSRPLRELANELSPLAAVERNQAPYSAPKSAAQYAPPPQERHLGFNPQEWRYEALKLVTALAGIYLLGWVCLTQPLTVLLLLYAFAIVGNSIDWRAWAGKMPWPYTALYAAVAAGLLGVTLVQLRRTFKSGLLPHRALWTVLGTWFALTYAAVYLCVRAGSTPWEVLSLPNPLLALGLVVATAALPLWSFLNLPLAVHRRRHQ